MMTKQQHIDYWVKTAEKDWIAVQQLFDAKSYVHSLFWAHLVLEKLCKAHWVKDNVENVPPKIHNLIVILETTKLQVSAIDLNFLRSMNQFQLEGRYPDYADTIYKNYKEDKTKIVIDNVKSRRIWLLENL